jgi:peptidyl-prolyl cis-trans isomerase C
MKAGIANALPWGSGLLIAVAGTLACHGGRLSHRDDRPYVAHVAGVPIYVDEFRREYKRLLLEGTEGAPAGGAEAAQKRALLDNLIDRRLLLQEVEHANVIIGTDEVEAAFGRARAGWDADEFNSNLSAKDLTPAELKNDLRENLLIRKYFRDHVFSRIAVTDQEIETYLAARPEELVEPEKVRALHLVVKTAEEAEHVLAEIKGGLSFEDAAMKYSLTPDGKSGGDLGLVPRGVMPHTFDEVCFSLPVGQTSKVIDDENGFCLFKVLEKRPQSTRALDAVREQVEAKIRREKERSAEELKLTELRKAATIDIQEEQLANIH